MAFIRLSDTKPGKRYILLCNLIKFTDNPIRRIYYFGLAHKALKDSPMIPEG